MADKLRDDLDDLAAEMEVATRRAEQSRLNKRIHLPKEILQWCVTRAGYRKVG